MKLEKMVLANALALATAVSWLVCSAFVVFLPEFSLNVTRWWLHGLDISALGAWKLDVTNFLLGGVSLTASVWGVGYVFGWAWELASGKK